MKEQKFRNEVKHFINISDYYTIKNRIKHVAQIDKNAMEDGKYRIRSLYFDNFANKALMEKINGINNREKFRIRFYNNDSSYIKLEKKSKIKNLTTKKAAVITKLDCERIIDNDFEWLIESDNNLLNDFYIKLQTDLLRPKTIVEYTREAYIYMPGNTRITLDSELRTGINSKDFFNNKLSTLKASNDGVIILEVKFDQFLPDIIRDIIQTNERRSTAISKYVACRIYG